MWNFSTTLWIVDLLISRMLQLRGALLGVLMASTLPFTPTCLQAGESREAAKAPQPKAVTINYVAQPMVNPLGGEQQEFGWLQGLWLNLQLGTGSSKPVASWSELDHWVLKARAAVVQGNGNYYQQIGAAYPLQTMTSAGQWITEASLSRQPGRGNVGVKVGVLTLNPSFMDLEAFNFYIHSAINDTFNNEVVGLPIAPLAALGGQINLGDPQSSAVGSLRLAAMAIPPNWFGRSTSSSPPAVQGSIGLLQWQSGRLAAQARVRDPIRHQGQLLPRQLPSPELLLGGYWSQTATVQPQQTGVPQGINRGLYGAATLVVPRRWLPALDSRVWMAVSYGFDAQNNPAPSFAATGVLMQGVIQSRPLDVLGLGIAATTFSGVLAPTLTPEAVVELNYALKLSTAFGLRPFAQVVFNPGGTNLWQPIVAAGMSLSFQF